MTQTTTTITVDSLPVANSIDAVQDLTLIYTKSALDIQGISRNTYLGLSSQPLGLTDSQSPTNKVFNNTNSLTVLDANLTIQDDGDSTKQAKFQVSGITTGTTRTYTLFDSSDTLVGLVATQTMTNKTLTNPVITGGSIDQTAITVDTISGHTTSNTGSVYGISVTLGTIGTAAIAANAITAAKMVNGVVLQRQGGTTGAASWATQGTSNTNVSTVNAFVQVGSIATSAGVDVTVTFPTAYSQKPIIVCSVNGDTTVTANAFAECISCTTTQAVFRTFNTAGAQAAQTINWIAIGQ